MGRILPRLLAGLLTIVVFASFSHDGAAQESWVIDSFNSTYDISQDSTIAVTEDIRVDFGSLERHGIFRDIPVEYAVNSTQSRLIEITEVQVDNGESPVRFQLEGGRPNLRIRIGDPDVLVSGRQRYVIHYKLSGAMNPQDDHDELFWNVVGSDWEVPISQASATVTVPAPGMNQQVCFEGPVGSTDLCTIQLEGDNTRATFSTRNALPPGSDLTIVIGTPKGAINVPPLVLVAPSQPVDELPSFDEVVDDTKEFLGLKLLTIVAAIGVFAVLIIAIMRAWWIAGRDRWYGNMYYATDNPAEDTKPLFSHETIVVEYTPPEIKDQNDRWLRPAEIGLLIDERADTLDVSATIVDLAVRKYLTITETEAGGILGMFKQKDYILQLVKEADDSLLAYEKRLLTALFETGQTVQMSELRNKFHDDLAEVKDDLYEESVKRLKLFPRSPDTVRTVAQVAGAVVIALGAGLTYLLGSFANAGLIGIAVVLAGILLLMLAHLMPRRTAYGRVMYRRSLGFRLFMVTAEKERQRFAEEKNIFHEYLPYAIVYGCVDKWAKAFEDLGMQESDTYWYHGTRAFAPMAFASNIGSFSSSVSTVMASTPGGSGGSGFGGGGGSGGGGGGGGGGSW